MISCCFFVNSLILDHPLFSLLIVAKFCISFSERVIVVFGKTEHCDEKPKLNSHCENGQSRPLPGMKTPGIRNSGVGHWNCGLCYSRYAKRVLLFVCMN